MRSTPSASRHRTISSAACTASPPPVSRTGPEGTRGGILEPQQATDERGCSDGDPQSGTRPDPAHRAAARRRLRPAQRGPRRSTTRTPARRSRPSPSAARRTWTPPSPRPSSTCRPPPRPSAPPILERAARLVAERAETFARTICLEAGKPMKQARAETARCVDTLTFSAVEARTLAGEMVPMDASSAGAGKLGMIVREPMRRGRRHLALQLPAQPGVPQAGAGHRGRAARWC